MAVEHVLHVQHGRQHLVGDLDPVHRLGGDFRGLRRHRRDGLAEEPGPVLRKQAGLGLAVRHDRGAGNVVGGHHGGDAGHGQGRGSVDGQDAGVMMGAAQDPGMQHALHLQVRRVFRRAVHGVRRVQPLDAAAHAAIAVPFRPVAAGASPPEPGPVVHRLEDLQVSGATAHVAGQAFHQSLAIGLRIAAQQRLRAHDHAGNAETALCGPHLQECLLQGMQHTVAAQPFDGGDRLAPGAGRLQLAGHQRLVVQQYDTATAFPVVTGHLRAGEVQILAQHVEQGAPGRNRQRPGFAVDLENDVRIHLRVTRRQAGSGRSNGGGHARSGPNGAGSAGSWDYRALATAPGARVCTGFEKCGITSPARRPMESIRSSWLAPRHMLRLISCTPRSA